ncbi:MAG: HEAT repeat domain-containing protein [Actinobacteria bacterium]|nr:HEAT repeat domain-containing protein [Actinomycetota bacterium]
MGAPVPETADAGARRRRRMAVLAGHRGDEAGARSLLADAEPSVRCASIGALARLGALTAADLGAALADPHPTVRRRACDAAGSVAGVDLRPLLADDDPSVVETAAWALGERGEGAADAVASLAQVAVEHADALCREAAVAALGAIGHRSGLAAILAATTDRPAVRRRAVNALAPFEGPEVSEALQRALADRDWQVRQAAEDLLDPGPDLADGPEP